MRVIGAGLPRTATTTQAIAFEMLGLTPCYHMRNLLMDLEKGLPLWEAVLDGKPDWGAIFGDAQSTVDWPAGRFYEQLMEAYPDAKVLLSVRSADGWVKSMRETVWGIFYGDSVMRHLSYARTVIDPLWKRYIDMMTTINFDPEVGSMIPVEDTYSDAGFEAVMHRWNKSVEEKVPAEKLLVWNPADGWEPLCDFLEVPMPSGPVPRTNDTSAFKEGITGGALALVNEWWDKRERPSESLHGAAAS